jgi:SagB-type dehydrogenase family enzyme
MKIKLFQVFILFILMVLSASPGCTTSPQASSSSTLTRKPLQALQLPRPRLKSEVSLEETLSKRRSVREYSEGPLTLNDVSQLLWSAQGVTSSSGRRTAPSAGALYPLEVYLIAGNVEGLSPGLYVYQPAGHELSLLDAKDPRNDVSRAALNQVAVKDGAISIIISAVYDRITPKYGERGLRYTYLEAGHAAQNICLQAVALNLGTVTIGAFDDNQLKDVLHLAENETPLYILPVGKAA